MADLKGKNILMFSPYGTCIHYTLHIKEELEKRGAIVYLHDERPSQSAWAKIYLYFFVKYAPQYFSNYLKKIVQEHRTIRLDYVFVVRGQAFDTNVLSYLRGSFPSAKFILYQWDPLCGKKVTELLECYDSAFSFDEADVENNPKFSFRPSLALKEYKDIADSREYDYDISFVGTLYNNRWPVIERFKKAFDSNGLKSYFYLYMASWTLYLWDFIFKGSFVSPKHMQFKPMLFAENVDLARRSKCVLDINYARQTGLSMRAFEAMVAKRKYITTNPEVKNYPFYRPENILVVDINNPIVPKDFIDTSFMEIGDDVMYRYTVEGFVDEIFG